MGLQETFVVTSVARVLQKMRRVSVRFGMHISGPERSQGSDRVLHDLPFGF